MGSEQIELNHADLLPYLKQTIDINDRLSEYLHKSVRRDIIDGTAESQSLIDAYYTFENYIQLYDMNPTSWDTNANRAGYTILKNSDKLIKSLEDSLRNTSPTDSKYEEKLELRSAICMMYSTMEHALEASASTIQMTGQTSNVNDSFTPIPTHSELTELSSLKFFADQLGRTTKIGWNSSEYNNFVNSLTDAIKSGNIDTLIQNTQKYITEKEKDDGPSTDNGKHRLAIAKQVLTLAKNIDANRKISDKQLEERKSIAISSKQPTIEDNIKSKYTKFDLSPMMHRVLHDIVTDPACSEQTKKALLELEPETVMQIRNQTINKTTKDFRDSITNAITAKLQLDQKNTVLSSIQKRYEELQAANKLPADYCKAIIEIANDPNCSIKTQNFLLSVKTETLQKVQGMSADVETFKKYFSDTAQQLDHENKPSENVPTSKTSEPSLQGTIKNEPGQLNSTITVPN